jgi:hypothetical protein
VAADAREPVFEVDFRRFRTKIVPTILCPLEAGADTVLRFGAPWLLGLVAEGRTHVRVSEIQELRPDLFSRAPLEGEDAEFLFPWGEVWDRIDRLGGVERLREIYGSAVAALPPGAPETAPPPIATRDQAARVERLLAEVEAGVAAGARAGAVGGAFSRPLQGMEREHYENLLAQFQRVSRERGVLLAELNEVRAGIESERCEAHRQLAAADERCRRANERAEAFAEAVELRDRELAITKEEIEVLKEEVRRLRNL